AGQRRPLAPHSLLAASAVRVRAPVLQLATLPAPMEARPRRSLLPQTAAVPGRRRRRLPLNPSSESVARALRHASPSVWPLLAARARSWRPPTVALRGYNRWARARTFSESAALMSAHASP